LNYLAHFSGLKVQLVLMYQQLQANELVDKSSCWGPRHGTSLTGLSQPSFTPLIRIHPHRHVATCWKRAPV
jgi:hypothetical protein